MLSFFRRRVGSAELALDLTAETFAAALEASGRYQLRTEPAEEGSIVALDRGEDPRCETVEEGAFEGGRATTSSWRIRSQLGIAQ